MKTYLKCDIVLIVTGNIAFNKPTSQLGKRETWDSGLAVDGGYNQTMSLGSCAHPFSDDERLPQSQYRKPAWWKVDLDGGDPNLQFVIKNITIFFRADCCLGTIYYNCIFFFSFCLLKLRS